MPSGSCIYQDAFLHPGKALFSSYPALLLHCKYRFSSLRCPFSIMHFTRATQARFALFSLLSLGSSLPLNGLEPLLKRATYSVVPVDGGSNASAGGSGQGDATIYKTIVITQTPETKTIIETNTAKITDYIISTQTVQLSGTVQTILVTVTTPAATTTTTGYSIIDVSASQVTITTTASPSSSSTISATSAPFETSSSRLEASPSSTETSSSTQMSSSVKTSSYPIATFSSTPTTSSQSHDNGQWHTYYPAWNASSTLVTSHATASISVEATTTPTSM
jgi:hypothetical protein